ncbi:hypothetical protein C8R45DRAFT_1189661 [Mycena sanguinolenta]|nr:hypothetical protein C8R45DRAFT_1189661 [Mycena sanguinolenta]
MGGSYNAKSGPILGAVECVVGQKGKRGGHKYLERRSFYVSSCHLPATECFVPALSQRHNYGFVSLVSGNVPTASTRPANAQGFDEEMQGRHRPAARQYKQLASYQLIADVIGLAASVLQLLRKLATSQAGISLSRYKSFQVLTVTTERRIGYARSHEGLFCQREYHDDMKLVLDPLNIGTETLAVLTDMADEQEQTPSDIAGLVGDVPRNGERYHTSTSGYIERSTGWDKRIVLAKRLDRRLEIGDRKTSVVSRHTYEPEQEKLYLSIITSPTEKSVLNETVRR